MRLSELKTGEEAIIVKVQGHGSFRKRLIEMGFIRGKKVKVILNAPLKDPIEYEILSYKLSLRREEASMIEVVGKEDTEAILLQQQSTQNTDNPQIDKSILEERMLNIANNKSKEIKVALVGNPNSGKTSLFNIASGSHEHVGNYSGVTVDSKEGHFEHKGYKFTLIDLPGTYSLSAYSPEELYVRKSLMEDMPDIVLNVVDASNLERNLYLSTQLIDMNLRCIMALNMYDELQNKGDKLDIAQLSKLLGMPIIPTISKTGEGIDMLFDKIIQIYNNEEDKSLRHIHVWHSNDIEKSISKIQNLIKDNEDIRAKFSTRYLAIKYLEHDAQIEKEISHLNNAKEIEEAREKEEKDIEKLLKSNIESAIVDAKYAYIQGALSETYTAKGEKHGGSFTDKIDKIVTNRILAFPIFILLLYIIFSSTFTVGSYPVDWINNAISYIGDMIATILPESWFKDLLIKGVIDGVGSVLVFLPNILILYFFISIMEDSGYMARAAFIIDKLMHKIGLHGKSFIPMVMGFGCNVPAIMATRTIESRKSRLITMLVIPFMSCSGRLPVFVLIAGAFFPHNAGLMLLLMYLLGIVIGIITAAVIGHFIKNDDLPFVMELPPYRIPTSKAIWRHTWQKGKQYLSKMGTTILFASMLIWFLGYYPKNDELVLAQEEAENINEALAQHNENSTNIEYLNLKKENLTVKIDSLHVVQKENSFIGILGKSLDPIMKPLGFNWRLNVALLTGIAAKELVVSTLGVIYSQGSEIDNGATLEEDTRLQQSLVKDISKPSALAFMIFILLYFPCVATFAVISRESNSWLLAVLCCTYTMCIAWIFSFIAYHAYMLFM